MQTDEKKMMTYQETMDYIDSLQSGGSYRDLIISGHYVRSLAIRRMHFPSCILQEPMEKGLFSVWFPVC